MGVRIAGTVHSRLKFGDPATLTLDASGGTSSRGRHGASPAVLNLLQRRGEREQTVLRVREAAVAEEADERLRADGRALQEQEKAPEGEAGLTIDVAGPLWVKGDLSATSLDVDVTNDSSQWVLVAHDTFELGAAGWSLNFTAPCGGPHRILGGPCRAAGAHTEKRYDLPHHRYVRVEARYYFIDEWRGYVGWMMLDQGTAWTEQHHATCTRAAASAPAPAAAPAAASVASAHNDSSAPRECPRALSGCGDPAWADRVGVLIDATRPHTSPVLRVAFGTHGMQAVDPCDASYGVQAVSVYVR
jgi:hypothetical protein